MGTGCLNGCCARVARVSANGNGKNQLRTSRMLVVSSRLWDVNPARFLCGAPLCCSCVASRTGCRGRVNQPLSATVVKVQTGRGKTETGGAETLFDLPEERLRHETNRKGR